MGYVSSQEGIHLHSVSYAIFKHGFSLVCPTARMRLECRPQQRFRRSPACFSCENRWNMYPIDIQGHLLGRYLDLPNLPKTSKTPFTSGGMTGCLGVSLFTYFWSLCRNGLEKSVGLHCRAPFRHHHSSRKLSISPEKECLEDCCCSRILINRFSWEFNPHRFEQ